MADAGCGRRGLNAPINARDDVEEHCEGVEVVGLAPRREHVLG